MLRQTHASSISEPLSEKRRANLPLATSPHKRLNLEILNSAAGKGIGLSRAISEIHPPRAQPVGEQHVQTTFQIAAVRRNTGRYFFDGMPQV